MFEKPPMSQGTKIEWAEATWNPVTGCTRVSAGCDNCYAVGKSHRLEAMGQDKYAGLTVLNPKGDRHFNGVVKCHEDALEIPYKRKTPTIYFVNSMGDLFHRDVPFKFIAECFTTMWQCPQHTFQILTKRPERLVEFYLWNYPPAAISRQEAAQDWLGAGPHIWLGTSVENADAVHRIDQLRQCPAAVRFLSLEPLLGPLDNLNLDGIGWVISGGESGPQRKLRATELSWHRSIRDQCKAAGVPFFFKQMGQSFIGTIAEGAKHQWRRVGNTTRPGVQLFKPRISKGGQFIEIPEDLRIRQWPEVMNG